MKKESKYVAFSTQKGGVGKTTLTVLVASYLHYVKGFNVAVVDCDYPQYSIVEMRERDLKTVMEDEHYKLMAYQQFTTLGKKAYPVVSSTPEDAAQVASQLAETGEFYRYKRLTNNPFQKNSRKIGTGRLKQLQTRVAQSCVFY